MNIPKPLLQLAYNLAMKNAGEIVATPLESVPHIDVIAKAYDSGEPLEVILGLYFQATATLTDDQIAGKVGEVLEYIHVEVPKLLTKISEIPAKDLVSDLLGSLTIPDFNGETGDEVKVSELINDTFKALAN